jgi:predicted DNA-binding transcriptional regulator AlpA
MTTEVQIVLSAEQVSKQLGLSVSTLAKLRLSGAGPLYSRLGRRIVYRPADIDTWVASNQFRSTSEYPAKSSGD